MLLNLIRNSYSKLTVILLLVCTARTVSAQEISPCEINGPASVAYGSSAVYYLSGNCATGTNLQTSCGQLSGSPSSSITVNFNNLSCTAATISTSNGAAQSLQVIITSALGGGNIINQFQSPINYNTAPQVLNTTPATGGSCGGAYQYQWFSSPDENTWSLISGATGQNYQPGPLTALTYFKREVICTLTGSTDNNTAYTDNWALVDVCSPVSIGNISPNLQYINAGAAVSQISISSVTGGCSSTYSYQWQSSPDNSTWTNINGATSSTYTPTSPASTTYYRLAVTSNGGITYSGSSEVYVYQATNIVITPAAPYVNYDSSPGPLTASGYSGSAGNYTFQWQSSTSSSFSSPSNVGTNSTTYTPGGLTATTYYRVQATNNGVVGISNTATVTVYPNLNQGEVNPREALINYNTVPPPFTVENYGGGNGSYTFQWQESTIEPYITFTNVGEDSSTYMPTTPDTASRTVVRCVVTSNGVSKATSSTTNIIIRGALVAGTLSPASQTITSGAPSTITLSGTISNVGVPLYQWQTTWDTTKPSNYLTINMPSDTSTRYIPPPNPGVEYYRVIVSSSATVPGVSGYISYASAYTNWAIVSMNSPLSGGTISGPSGTIPYNTSPGTLGSTQDAAGGACYPADFRYQWQYSADGVNFYNLLGAIANTYTPAALTASIYFRRQVTCGTTTLPSNSIYIQVTPQTQSNCTVSN